MKEAITYPSSPPLATTLLQVQRRFLAKPQLSTLV
jgi:hypothetical protein